MTLCEFPRQLTCSHLAGICFRQAPSQSFQSSRSVSYYDSPRASEWTALLLLQRVEGHQ